MAKVYEIKNAEDRSAALDVVKRKIKGITIPKKSHAHILNVTKTLITCVEELNQGRPVSLSIASGLGEKSIKISSTTPLPENFVELCKNDAIAYSTDFISVKNKDGEGSVTFTVKGSASYALLKTFITVGMGLIFTYLIKCFE